MFGLGALLALEVTSTTPDALCPPLDEARAAVSARVGDVEGNYQAEFSLSRGADGKPSLILVVREDGVVVLQRLLPIDGAACEDAAQAIALVLERFFDAVKNPGASSAQAEPVPVVQEPVPAPVLFAKQPRLHDHDQPSTREKDRRSTIELRAGATFDGEHALAPSAGVGFFPDALRFGTRAGLGVSLDGAAFLANQQQTVRDQELTVATWQLAVSLPVRLQLSSSGVVFAAGPWAQLRLQRAQAPSLRDSTEQFRAVPGAGGIAGVSWAFYGSWAVAGDAAAGAQLAGLAPRFVLDQPGGGTQSVLDARAWFLQSRLALLRSF